MPPPNFKDNFDLTETYSALALVSAPFNLPSLPWLFQSMNLSSHLMLCLALCILHCLPHPGWRHALTKEEQPIEVQKIRNPVRSCKDINQFNGATRIFFMQKEKMIFRKKKKYLHVCKCKG